MIRINDLEVAYDTAEAAEILDLPRVLVILLCMQGVLGHHAAAGTVLIPGTDLVLFSEKAGNDEISLYADTSYVRMPPKPPIIEARIRSDLAATAKKEE